MHDRFKPPMSFAFTAGLFEAMLLLAAVGAGWLLRVSPLETLHASVRAAVIGALAALPALGVMIVCVRWPGQWFAQLRTVVDELLGPLFRQLTLTEMAIISLLAGLGEEVLFRGVFQAAIARRLGGSAMRRRILDWVNPRLDGGSGGGSVFRAGTQHQLWLCSAGRRDRSLPRLAVDGHRQPDGPHCSPRRL